MMMSSTDALPVKSEAHMFHRRMPDDSAFLVTPDAELCARHHASLAQVWAWRTQLSQQQSPLYHRTSTIAAPSASGHREPQDTTETTLEGGTPHSPHRPCTAANLLRSCCRATPPHLLTGSGSDAHGRVSAAASAAAAVVAASSSHLFLPTGLRSLDAALLGGLRRGWVTELTGLPGTGKTTLAAEWCRSCLRHARSCGTAHDCVWLQSGSAVHSAVLATAHEEADATELSSLVDAVHVACLSSLDGLQQLLARWQGTEGSASPLSTVGLIVLDSITDLMRRSFRCEDDDALQRHEALATTLQSLKRLAEEQRVAVLVITQQQRHPWPALGRSSISHTIRGVYEEDGNEDEDDSEAWGSEYSRHASGGAGVVGPHACRSDFSSEDVGQLGRLFFHNVNVRLQLRAGVRSAGCRPSPSKPFDAGGPEGDREALRLRWQLEVLKSPLCAPFAVGLQLRVPTSLSCSDDPPCVPGLPLCVEEVDDDDGSRGSAVPLAPNTQVEEGLSLLSLDPWDYTEVPSFLYL
ncbi:hypothetical protein, conserved [Leishmania donovani]|uniref:Rad51/AAA domain/KaiC/ATPase family associated with various cellular activities (AAA), putative n=1 Tax=Leishmania donovani TaxID=5661 RepID=E9BAL1_LEIDO|nr:hypothetical protein, conserved [Leishmania donovani]AYU76792.1 Rad51/AAA domain/KaiC/ATPase family associated with various cellular activities (AAA), putative [Leishmania donovani]CBZ32286.1 hypothetical protein, conserved [Leishmania donovani]